MTLTLPTTPQQQVSQLLGCAIEQLDLTADEMQAAHDRYHDLASHLAAEDTDVYVQGSFMLGTVVRPRDPHGEFDLDLVCHNDLGKTSVTQAELKVRVGAYLRGYVEGADGVEGEVPKLDESRRCWTLGWARFHMDVLPAIPNAEVLSPTAILLTDKQLLRWQQSDPKAYVKWFRARCEPQISYQRKVLARTAGGKVDDVPEWKVRTPLHRAVQVLKRHRDLFFAPHSADLRPPSSLLTTLAGLSYLGEEDLLDATLNVVQRMPQHIEMRSGRAWVANPVCEENFADKWNEYPERREAFFQWRDRLGSDLEAVLTSEGSRLMHAGLQKVLGAEPVRRAVTVIGERTRSGREDGALSVSPAGLLTAGTGSPVPPHRFFGGPSDA